LQITLFGEIRPEEKFSLLGFVKGEDIKVEKDVWFIVLNPKQIDLLNECLKERSSF
jgi:hypothetical protein